MKRKRLGEVLRDRGHISSEDLQKVIVEQQGKVIRLGELMLERGLVDKEDLAAALSEISHAPYQDCSLVAPHTNALEAIPRAIAERCCVLPIAIENKRLVVVMAAPQNLNTIDELRFISGMEISPRLAFRADICEAIEAYYSAPDGVPAAESAATPQISPPAAQIEFVSTSSRESNREAVQEIQADLKQQKTPAVRLVSQIIVTAMTKLASDIHIEPRATETIVRIRVDGVLRDLFEVPRNLQNSLISRIKILADMDISERRNPQDGRCMVRVGDRQLDLRISTLPTQYGEKVVLRLLETSAPLTSFANLGMPKDVEEGLSELLLLPQGMILVTGPTGSGKSTTLYSALEKLRKPTVNIVTVEDPVEYVLPGINQVHVNIKAGLTFASCIRSILRQDPNIIMVGEIRDRETAEIVMTAAQTGHLVLSTLHTNDSIAALVRLHDLGIPGYLISSSVTGIVAQRLVRKLCDCHSVEPASEDFQTRLAQLGMTEIPQRMAVPSGCENCGHTGYKGRVGIYELLRLDDQTREIIRTGGNIDEIRRICHAKGMRLMQDDALEKLHIGITTLEEVLRVVPVENVATVRCTTCGEFMQSPSTFCPHCGGQRPTQELKDRPARIATEVISR